jgi:hypothetical protein
MTPASAKTTWKLLRVALFGAFVLSVVFSHKAEAVSVTNSTFGSIDAGQFSRTFLVAGETTIADVNIAIDFSKCDDPNPGPGATGCTGGGFSFNDEIEFDLISPTATTVRLVIEGTYDGQMPGARVTVNFDDEAASPVGGSVLVSGAFRPIDALSVFDGENPNGIWTLVVRDTFVDDPLQFYSATLNINSVTVPEPASFLLLGLGALALLKRRA